MDATQHGSFSAGVNLESDTLAHPTVILADSFSRASFGANSHQALDVHIGLPLVAACKLAALNTPGNSDEEIAQTLGVTKGNLLALRRADVRTTTALNMWGSALIPIGLSLSQVAEEYIGATLAKFSPPATADVLEIPFLGLCSKHFIKPFSVIGSNDPAIDTSSLSNTLLPGRNRQIEFFEYLGKGTVPVALSASPLEVTRAILLGASAKFREPFDVAVSLGWDLRKLGSELAKHHLPPPSTWVKSGWDPLRPLWFDFRNSDDQFVGIPIPSDANNAAKFFFQERDRLRPPVREAVTVVVDMPLIAGSEVPLSLTLDEARAFYRQACASPSFKRRGTHVLDGRHVSVPKNLRSSLEAFENWHIERAVNTYSLPAAAKSLGVSFDQLVTWTIAHGVTPLGKEELNKTGTFRDKTLEYSLALNTDLFLRGVLRVDVNSTFAQIEKQMVLASLVRNVKLQDVANELDIGVRTLSGYVSEYGFPNFQSWKGVYPFSLETLFSSPLDVEKSLLVPLDLGIRQAQLQLFEHHLLHSKFMTQEEVAAHIGTSVRLSQDLKHELPFRLRLRDALDRHSNYRSTITDDDRRAAAIVNQMFAADAVVNDEWRRAAVVEMRAEQIPMTAIAWALRITLNEAVALEVSSLLAGYNNAPPIEA